MSNAIPDVIFHNGQFTTLNGKPVGEARGSVNTSTLPSRASARIDALYSDDMPDSSL